jgi:signal transduction histidine kinase
VRTPGPDQAAPVAGDGTDDPALDIDLGPGFARGPGRRVRLRGLREDVRGWRDRWPTASEVLFAFIGLPLAVASLVYVALILYAGGLLAITILGLPVVAVLLGGVRALGQVHRLLVGRLLTVPLDDPGRVPRAGSALRWIRNRLTDPVAWRAVLYLVIRVPLAALTFVGGVATWIYGVFFLLYPFLRPAATEADFSISLLIQGLVVGTTLLGLAPWSTRATADLNRSLARVLLAAPPPPARLAELVRARSEVAADAATTLKQIERDLHDGTQARLVALAVSLALADEALTAENADRAQELVQRARSQLGDATVELRQLTRGINPVALDGGLTEALPTLAADAGIATELRVDLPVRPSPAIERVVYFCTAELLTNAAKHSGADRARVEVTGDSKGVRLRVSDRGQGGATLGAGSGLRGLRDRLTAVDGTLDVASPAGGPTVVTAELPLAL